MEPISFAEAREQVRRERLEREETARREGRVCSRCGDGVFSRAGESHQRCALCGGCLSGGHYCGEGEDTLGEGVYLPEDEPTGGYY